MCIRDRLYTRHRIRRQCTSHLPGAVFRARLPCNQESAKTKRAHVFEKFPARCFQRRLFGTDTIPTVDMSSMENRPRGVLYTPSYTAGYVNPVARRGNPVQYGTPYHSATVPGTYDAAAVPRVRETRGARNIATPGRRRAREVPAGRDWLRYNRLHTSGRNYRCSKL